MAISLDKATLEAALIGYSQQLQQIEAKMADIRRMLSGAAPAKQASAATPGKQKHRMSPEGRERIAAAQRARWAKVKNASAGQQA